MGKKKLLLIYLALLPIISYAKIVLPNILNDNMVLQQQTSVKLWGKANPNKKVKVLPSWNEIEYSTIADADGKWMVTVSTPKAGGPYEIRFTDGEELTLKNILIGVDSLAVAIISLAPSTNSNSNPRTGISIFD